MALTVDSFQVLWDNVVSDLRPFRDALIGIGALVVAKWWLKATRTLTRAVKVFGVAQYWPQSDWMYKYGGDWAVVTGCTQGIGYAYAKEVAKRGLNLVLVARNKDRLMKVAVEMEQSFGVQTAIVVIDFANEDPADICAKISGEIDDKQVSLLLNNVGTMQQGPKFHDEIEPHVLRDIVRVNVGAVTHLCHMIIPSMVARGRGAIVNVSSGTTICPCPLMASYAASKSYVTYLTEALISEYGCKGLTIQCLSPCLVRTNMSEFSGPLPDSIFMPTPERYAASAIRTLGWASVTYGYWPHSLQMAIGAMLPKSWKIPLFRSLNVLAREELIKKMKAKDE